MRALPGFTLAALLLATPALADVPPQMIAAGDDALVVTATDIAHGAGGTAAIPDPADRVRLLVSCADARERRGAKPAAQALRAEATVLARALKAGAAPVLALVAASEARAGNAARAQGLLAEADARALPAEKRALGRALADASLAAEAEPRLGMGTAEDRAKLAGAWHHAHDDVKAAARAGEALAMWRRLPPAEAQNQAPGLATALWESGYPTLSMDVARTLKPAAWPRAVMPLMTVVGAHPASAKAKAATAPWLEVALERCNAKGFADMPAEAELLAGIAMAFKALDVPDRAGFTLIAADERLTDTLNLAGDAADTPTLTADRAAAQVTIGTGYLRLGKGQAGLDRLQRGERLAASLETEGTPPAQAVGARIRARAAVARAENGPPEQAVRAASHIRHPYHRADALLKIDALDPAAASRFDEDTRRMLVGPDAADAMDS